MNISGYIMQGDKAIITKTNGEIEERDNVDNLLNLLEIENSLYGYKSKLFGLETDKTELLEKRASKKSDSIFYGSFGIALPFIVNFICNSMNNVTEDDRLRTMLIAFMFSSYNLTSSAISFIKMPKQKIINNLNIRIDNVKLTIQSIEEILEKEKDKSHKVLNTPLTIKNNVGYMYDDDLDEYYGNNIKKIEEEYISNGRVVNNNHTYFENSLLTQMIINDKRLTKIK